MNWHEPTQAEIAGDGDHRYIVDVYPDHIPYQAAADGDALLRISRPGWMWWIKDRQRAEDEPFGYGGQADTREAAIGDALAELGKLRAEKPANG